MTKNLSLFFYKLTGKFSARFLGGGDGAEIYSGFGRILLMKKKSISWNNVKSQLKKCFASGDEISG